MASTDTQTYIYRLLPPPSKTARPILFDTTKLEIDNALYKDIFCTWWDEISDIDYQTFATRENGEFLSRAELGCKLSHRTAIQHYLSHASEHDICVVFEDDISADFDLLASSIYQFSLLAETNISSAMLALLGDIKGGKVLKKLRAKAPSSEAGLIEVWPETTAGVFGSFAYAVNYAGAKRYLERSRAPFKSDQWWKILGFACKYYYSPAVLHPPQTQSTIGSERKKFLSYDSRTIYTRTMHRLITSLRRLFNRNMETKA